MDYEYYSSLTRESDKLEYLAKVDREKKAKEEARTPKHVTESGEVIKFASEADKLLYLMKHDVKIKPAPSVGGAEKPKKKFDLANMTAEEINNNWDEIKKEAMSKIYK